MGIIHMINKQRYAKSRLVRRLEADGFTRLEAANGAVYRFGMPAYMSAQAQSEYILIGFERLAAILGKRQADGHAAVDGNACWITFTD